MAVGVVASSKRVGVGSLCNVDDGGSTTIDDGWFGATGDEEGRKGGNEMFSRMILKERHDILQYLHVSSIIITT